MIYFLTAIVFLAGPLFGAIPDPPEKLPSIIDLFWYSIKNYPEIIAEIGAFLIAFLTFLRGLGEMLKYVSSKTESNFDNKIVGHISQIVKWLSKLLIWFGIGNGKR